MPKAMNMETVTVKKATDWLNQNKSNRKLRPGVAEKYAEDMATGRWTECAAPIVFYENGDVADGQHRLFAIVESGIPQEFYVIRGFDRTAGLNIDTGLGRSLVDNARISGVNPDLSNELIAISRAVEEGSRQMQAVPNSRRLDYVNKHNDACRWAITNGPRGKKLRNSIILAAVARAWYWESDKDKLKRFCEIVTSGFSEGRHEAAAVALRNYLLTSSKADINSPALWRDTFLKIQNAISYFMRNKPLVLIKQVKDEAYPLKKEAKKRA